MAKIHDIKAARDQHLAHARSIESTGTAAELRAASQEVEAAQKELIAHITEGAKPCPFCKAPPMGMEHPTGKGGFELEIGCMHCPAFKHTDGTLRNVRVVGGMLPKHTVEVWNEGPDFFQIVPPHKVHAAHGKIRHHEAIKKLAAEQAQADKVEAERISKLAAEQLAKEAGIARAEVEKGSES